MVHLLEQEGQAVGVVDRQVVVRPARRVLGAQLLRLVGAEECGRIATMGEPLW